MKFGFDIDGVLVNDIDAKHLTDSQRVETMLQVRQWAVPLFDFDRLLVNDLGQPQNEVYLVTARPKEDEAKTWAWYQSKVIMGSKTVSPQIILVHNKEPGVSTDERAAAFKAKAIQTYGLETFVESSDEQCVLIQRHLLLNDVQCQVIHFKSWITERLLRM